MSITDYFSAIGNAAATLMLSFIGGSVPSIAARAGTKRRRAREAAAEARRKTLYAVTPAIFSPSRQVTRRTARSAAKAAAHKFNNPRYGKRPKQSERATWRSILAAPPVERTQA